MHCGGAFELRGRLAYIPAGHLPQTTPYPLAASSRLGLGLPEWMTRKPYVGITASEQVTGALPVR